MELRTKIKIGEADAGLEADASKLFTPDVEQPFTITFAQREYLSSLPTTEVLLARAAAYERNNTKLQAQAKSLQNRSSELEAKLRRVVTLCTGVPDEKVDSMMGGLVLAIESENGEDVEVGRVREFLRRVEGKGGN